MTLEDLLAEADIEPPSLAGAAGLPKKCYRHDWYFGALGDEPPVHICTICGTVRDETRSKRGRNAAKRGKRIQHDRIVGLGGRNLAGNNPNLDGLGAMFAYESKSGGSFSQRYWRWLTDIPKRGNETGVLIVTEAPGPGRKARSYVVVEYDEWRELHGE